MFVDRDVKDVPSYFFGPPSYRVGCWPFLKAIFFSRWNFAFYILLTILLKHPINILSACSARGCPYNIPATSYSYAHHLSVCVLNFWFQHPTDHPNQHPIIIPYRFRGGGARFPIIVDPASYHIGYVHIQIFIHIHIYRCVCIRTYKIFQMMLGFVLVSLLPSSCHPTIIALLSWRNCYT